MTITKGTPSVSKKLETKTTSAEKVARKLARKAARVSARAVVRSRMNEIPDKDGLRAAVIVLVGDGTRAFGGGGSSSKLATFLALFNTSKVVSSIDAFKAMKIGISEAKKLIRKNDKNADAPGYKKIVYDPIMDAYKA